MSMILASASPRRAQLLRELGVPFTVVAAAVEEVSCGPLSAGDVAVTNACRKALAVARDQLQALVLGADTVVGLDDRLYGKPEDRDAAVTMLKTLSGRTHSVTTGVCLAGPSMEALTVFAETTHVTFRSLSTSQIAEYLDRVHVLDKAGAYAIQEHGESLVEAIDGSRSNVVGLPLERLRAVLGVA